MVFKVVNPKRKEVKIALLLSFLLVPLSSAECVGDNPIIKSDSFFELSQGENFKHDFELSNMDGEAVKYAFVLLDGSLSGVSLTENGLMRFTAGADEVGTHKLMIIAFKEECVGSLIVTIKVNLFESFTYIPKKIYVKTYQNQTTSFKINSGVALKETIGYEWLVDNKILSEIKTNSYDFTPLFKDVETHNITVVVKEGDEIIHVRSWFVKVININRPPVLLIEVPNFMVFANTKTGAYFLNDYFKDPDGDELTFDYEKIIPDFEIDVMKYADVNVIIDKSFVTYNPENGSIGHVFFRFIASDDEGLTAESSAVRVDVIDNLFIKNRTLSLREYCGDHVCSFAEDCTTCPYDCGECSEDEIAGCQANWNCTEWSPCWPIGVQNRSCYDTNDCDDNRTKPDEIKLCVYDATCDDGLKNGIETGVDCGGPCDPCATCDDGEQNQGELGVDCGGPCDQACPSCNDGIMNQNESDVDCGTGCQLCVGGKSCRVNLDCESYKCEYLVCSESSCYDEINNCQGEVCEKGIDCEGPCEAICNTCNDGVKNGGEIGIDCGGKCRPCPTCNDGVKNGEEVFTDCGDGCRKCTVKDFFGAYGWLAIIVIILLILFVLALFGYWFFLLTNPERVKKLYDNNLFFTFMVSLNRIQKKIKARKYTLPNSEVRQFMHDLNEAQKSSINSGVPIHDVIERAYMQIFNLPQGFDDNIFNLKVRASSMCICMKILLVGFYRKADMLLLNTFIADEEKNDFVVEMKFLLSELSA